MSPVYLHLVSKSISSNASTAALGRKQPFRSRGWDGLNNQLLSVRFRPQAGIKASRQGGRSYKKGDRLRLVGFLLPRPHQVDAAGFGQVRRVSIVQLSNNLLHRRHHRRETPLSVATNGVGAFKRDYIAMPVGAFRAGRRLCSLDRYDVVGLCQWRGFISHACSCVSDHARQLEAGQCMMSAESELT
jgi:hypothetical protein